MLITIDTPLIIVALQSIQHHKLINIWLAFETILFTKMDNFIKTVDYNHPCIVYRIYDFPRELTDILDKYDQYNYEIETKTNKFISHIPEDIEMDNKYYIITIKLNDIEGYTNDGNNIKAFQLNLFETDYELNNPKNLFRVARTFVNTDPDFILKNVLDGSLIIELFDVLRTRNHKFDFDYFKRNFKVIKACDYDCPSFDYEINRFYDFIIGMIDN